LSRYTAYLLIALATVVLAVVRAVPVSETSSSVYWVAIIPDPVGDDKGTGSIVYPTNSSLFQPGVFDLTEFAVGVDSEYVYFNLTFRNLGGNPWNGANGFSLQYIHIYVLTSNEELPRAYYTYGLNVSILHGWNYAVLLTGSWKGEGEAVDKAVPEGERSAVYNAYGHVLAIDTEPEKLAVSADSETNTITARVKKTLLSDVDNIDKWTVVVAVAGYDGPAPYRVRPVKAGDPDEWNFGGGDPEAVQSGVQPLVIDLLAYTASEQYDMLRSYKTQYGVKASVYGVKLSPPLATLTVTSTVTTTTTVRETTTVTVAETTVTATTTTTEIAILTTTATVYSTITETTTATTTVQTTIEKTVTEKTTTTLEKPVVRETGINPLTALVLVVGIGALGVVVGKFLLR